MKYFIFLRSKSGFIFDQGKKNLFDRLSGFIKEEAAQATTEYILLLSISVSLFMILKKMLSPAFQKLTESLQSRINRVFDPKALHQFRVR